MAFRRRFGVAGSTGQRGGDDLRLGRKAG